MRVVYNTSTCPYFNLAAEEYLAKNYSGDIFMLWRNAASVIIGKNQEPLAEVDLDYVRRENINVVRRITGGGAVFHDVGNINYTFITKAGDGLDFAKFAAPVICALKKTGIHAVLGGRNDITADGFKISGNAQCRVKSERGLVTLHHGTLLFSADVSVLAGALKPNKLKLDSKGIKSVSSRVKNIVSFDTYSGPRDPEKFIFELFRLMGTGTPESFSEKEISEINALADEKYRTWEWNFGASPAFETVRSGRFPFGTVTAQINCRGERIENIKFTGDFFGEDTNRLEEFLVGSPFEKEAFLKRLKNADFNIGECIYGADAEAICALVFPEDSTLGET